MNKNDILSLAWDMLSHRNDIQKIHEISLSCDHVTFIGRVGEGVLSSINAKTKTIRVYRDEITTDFLMYGNLSKEFGLNYHFFGNQINKWHPSGDDAECSYTDLLVLEFEDDEETIIAVDKYKHLTKKFLLIYKTKNIHERLEVRLKGYFEMTFQSVKNFTVYTKTKS